MERLDTTGEAPGWIYKHDAEFDLARQVISVRNGRRYVESSGGPRSWLNVDEYELHLPTYRWRRVTNRNWAQFALRPVEGGPFRERVDFEGFSPSGLASEEIPIPEERSHRLAVEGIAVRLVAGVGAIEIVIEGALPDTAARLLLEDVRRYVEAAARTCCRIDAL